MKSRIVTLLALIGGLVVGATLWEWLDTDPPPADGPVVPRLAGTESAAPRRVTAEQLLEWGRRDAPFAVVDVARDALPNGLALTMVGVLVDWDHSDVEDDGGSIRVRNVSVGGNPVLGQNILATADVPLDAVTGAEWCLTVTRGSDGKDTFMGHAQLRFLFAAGSRPRVLGGENGATTVTTRLDDLILSWEAWRPPLAAYDPLQGLDPEQYALTVRAYAGAQRFLMDALRGNPWVCYPLALPESGDAPRQLLLTALAMGDALMRRTVQGMVEDGSIDAGSLETAATLPEAEKARLRAVFATSGVPTAPLAKMMTPSDLSYHLLERSCITLSFTAIQWALQRIHEDHDLGAAPEIRIVPDDLPPWIDELAEAGTIKLAGYLPGVIWYLARRGEVLPSGAYRVLDEAGLLQRREGQPIRHYYDRADTTPYGRLRDNLM